MGHVRATAGCRSGYGAPDRDPRMAAGVCFYGWCNGPRRSNPSTSESDRHDLAMMLTRAIARLPLAALPLLLACGSGDVMQPPRIAGISLVPSTLELRVGASTSLTVAVSADGGAPTGFELSSSAPAVAQVAADGRVTAIMDGEATITARSTFDRTRTATAFVRVLPHLVVDVAIDSVTIPLGASYRAAATVSPPGSRVLWESSASLVATVDSTGLITAVGPGFATIIARAADDIGATGTVRVLVLLPMSTSIVIGRLTHAGSGQSVDVADLSGAIDVSVRGYTEAMRGGRLEIIVDDHVVATASVLPDSAEGLTTMRAVRLDTDARVSGTSVLCNGTHALWARATGEWFGPIETPRIAVTIRNPTASC